MSSKILITGGAGFIGSHLALELANLGYKIRILDHFSPQVHGKERCVPELFELAASPTNRIEIMEGDIRSRHDLLSALFGVDTVFHFAAAVGIGQSMYEVKSYVENNSLGTANLLQVLTERPIKKLILASSMSIYGEGLYQTEDGKLVTEVQRNIDRLKSHDWEPITEEGHRLIPLPTPESKKPDLASIYALSKFDQERMCLLIGQAYRIPTIALRFFSVYGRGQSLRNPYSGTMAIFAARLLHDQRPLIYEDGNQLRDFVHISDVIQACRLALEVPEAAGKVFNIASGNSYPIREIAERMAHSLGKQEIRPEMTHQYRVGDIRHCFADISLAQRILGYSPKITLEQGLQDLSEWIRRKRSVDKTIQAYEELTSKGLAL
jgi:dTDP-L-rhamnose 4-epimerase